MHTGGSRAGMILGALAIGILLPAAPPAIGKEVAGAESSTRSPQSAAWSFWKEPIPSASLGRIVRRVHTVTVVEFTTSADPKPRGMTKALKRKILEGAADILEETIPGLDVRWRWKVTRKAPPSVCSNPYEAFSQAATYVPETRYARILGQHLAVIVNCGNGAGMSLTYPPGGSSQIWGPWSSLVLAHELGHSLGLSGHSGSLDCEGRPLSPRTCGLMEYVDDIDLMGALSGTYLIGVWRDLVVGSQAVPADRESVWRLDSVTSGKAARPLRITSRYGWIYLDHVTIPRAGNGLTLRLAIDVAPTAGDPDGGLHQVGLWSPSLAALGDVVFIGESHRIPGTRLTVSVEGAEEGKLIVKFTPRA